MGKDLLNFQTNKVERYWYLWPLLIWLYVFQNIHVVELQKPMWQTCTRVGDTDKHYCGLGLSAIKFVVFVFDDPQC